MRKLFLIIVLIFLALGYGYAEDTDIDEEADALLSAMSLHDKVCQLFIVTPEEITGEKRATSLTDEGIHAFVQSPYGGIVIFGKNIESEQQLRALTSSLKVLDPVPFIIAEEEGGDVSRLSQKLDVPLIPSAPESAKNGNAGEVYEDAVTIAQILLDFGFNMDLAPLADINIENANPYLKDRCFSDFPAENALYALEFMTGLRESGIVSVYKYFPGTGTATWDLYQKSTQISKPEEEIFSEDILPFRLGIAGGTDAVMVSDAFYYALDPEYPACLSKHIVSDILKEKLGFKGIVITDALNTESITSLFGSSHSVLLAIDAGCDMIYLPSNASSAVSAIENAVVDGRISVERINESVRKILLTKLLFGVID